ncbi:MAG: hypothetical protein LBD18_00435 [Treponema sp.]|jgi:hypothetical protein|nr:hypothetical protein [Treponema sp.]
MIQLYFLSILLNGVTGYILITGDGGDTGSIENSLHYSLRNSTFRLVLGILTAATGILKLLSPVLDNIPLLGDLLPALAGIAAGFILVFGYYREHSSLSAEEAGGKLDRIGDAFLHYKKAAGIALLAAALLHFLFPQALFL